MFVCLKIFFAFFADNKPVQVMMTLKNTRYLLCTLHRKKKWQVPLDLIFEKGTLVTLSCNGTGYVHLIGYFKNKILEEQDWIKTLSKQLLNGKIKELKSGGESVEELTNYLKNNEKIEIDGDWIVKSMNEEEPNKKVKQTVKRKTSPKSETTKRKKSSLKSNAYNDDSDEDCDNSENKDDSDENRDNSNESRDDFEDFEFIKNSDDDNYENDELIIPSSLSEKKYKSENDTEMQQSEEKESEKPQKKGKQQKKQNKVEKKFKEENDKTKKKQQQNYENISIIEGGVQVEELKLGTGKTVQQDDYVTIYYEARVQIGTHEPKIDECKERLGFRFQAGAGLVLRGLDAGIIGMKVGGKRRLIIPHNMAYVLLFIPNCSHFF